MLALVALLLCCGSRSHNPQANDTGVTLVGSMTNPTGKANSYFGSAIDSINGTLLVAGAYRNDVGPFEGAGDAYMIAVGADGGTLNQTCVLAHPDPQDFASFGENVAVAGPWLVISTRSYDGEYINQGAVILYKVCCLCLCFVLCVELFFMFSIHTCGRSKHCAD